MSALSPKSTRALFAPALAILMAASVVLAAPAASGADAEPAAEPVWTQFQGDPAHTGAPSSAPAPPYELAWTFTPSSGSLSGAVIVGDVAIAVGKEAVYGVDATTGELTWSVPRDGGPPSTPAVAPGRSLLLYLEGPEQVGPQGSPSPSPTADELGADPDADGASELVAVDLGHDRRELWRVTLEGASRGGVTAAGGTAFVADDDGTVYAVSLADGSIAWTATVAGEVLAPPAVADEAVFVTARDQTAQTGSLVALDAETGEARWTFELPGGGAAVSGVAVTEEGPVAGWADRLVRALSGGEQDPPPVRWSSLSVSLFSPGTAPALGEGSAFAADVGGGVYRFDAETGRRLWDHQLNELVVRSAPVLVPGHVLIGLEDGRLVALDLGSGNLAWQSEATSGRLGPIAVTPEAIVVPKGGDEAGLLGFVHDPAGSLVDVPSPTKVDPPVLLGVYAAALAIVLLALSLPFRVLARRIGPPEFPGDEEETTGDRP